MRIADTIVSGRFLRRDNRFRAAVEVNGKETAAHVPNSGRLTELFVHGAEVALVPRNSPHRTTAFDLVQVKYLDRWVSTDSRLPVPLVIEAFERGKIDLLSKFESYRKEPKWGSGRFDLAFDGGDDEFLVEVKSVTLVIDGVGRFPDAPTSRGTRHVTELAEIAESSGQCALFFVIQRDDAVSFSPHGQQDPAFAEACERALAGSVHIKAFSCETSLGEITISHEIPVRI